MTVIRFPIERTRPSSIHSSPVKKRNKYQWDIIHLIGPISKKEIIESFKQVSQIEEVIYFSDLKKTSPHNKQLLIIDDIISLSSQNQQNLINLMESNESPIIVVLSPKSLSNTDRNELDHELLKDLDLGEIQINQYPNLSLSFQIENILYGPSGILMF